MKKILWMFALLMSAGSMSADNFSIENINIKPGETKDLVIRYQFETTGQYAGYQFELKLPTGITTIRDEGGESEFIASNAHDSSFMISNSYDETSGSVVFVALSLQGKTLKNTEGVLLTIPVRAANDIETGKVLNGCLENIQLSKQDGVTTVLLNNVDFTITAETATGIQAIGSKRVAKGHIYNIAGQVVGHSVSPDVYIVNGRKVAVKHRCR